MSTTNELIEQDLALMALEGPEWENSIIHHHVLASGLEDPPVSRRCFVYSEREEGSNENQISGSGRELDDLEGRRIRTVYGVLIQCDTEIGMRDWFELDGMRWQYIRTLDRSRSPLGTKRVEIVNIEGDFTRAPRLRGVGARSRGGSMG